MVNPPEHDECEDQARRTAMYPRAMVLTPNRELAFQVGKFASARDPKPPKQSVKRAWLGMRV